jgi:8-oxo-dGTP pyrophosphatase MutT (NUDIX family)
MNGALAPAERGARDPGPSSAAVSAIFRDGDGLEVLLIRRAERAGDPWSGHMAFPGGRRDPKDADLFATSVRETQEEVGLDLEAHAALLGVLDDQEATSKRRNMGMPIRPFVYRLNAEPPALAPNAEVSEALWTPIAPLFRGERESSIEVAYENVRYTLPAFDVDGRIVWGLTYRMLQEIFTRLRAVL